MCVSFSSKGLQRAPRRSPLTLQQQCGFEGEKRHDVPHAVSVPTSVGRIWGPRADTSFGSHRLGEAQRERQAPAPLRQISLFRASGVLPVSLRLLQAYR